MNNTFLVQRLDKKPKSDWHAKVSQVFGGGMVMMTDEGWKAIQSVCVLSSFQDMQVINPLWEKKR